MIICTTTIKQCKEKITNEKRWMHSYSFMSTSRISVQYYELNGNHQYGQFLSEIRFWKFINTLSHGLWIMVRYSRANLYRNYLSSLFIAKSSHLQLFLLFYNVLFIISKRKRYNGVRKTSMLLITLSFLIQTKDPN